jgi:hypothetical protein
VPAAAKPLGHAVHPVHRVKAIAGSLMVPFSIAAK